MKAFELSPCVELHKIFLTKFSELKERYDPYFYKGDFHQLRKTLVAKGFKPLGSYVESWARGDGPRDGFYTDNQAEGVRFLRINNLKNNSIDLSEVKFIHRKIHETKLKRAQVTAGDLIFAISGTKENLGTVSIVPDNIKEANINSALVRFKLSDAIDKEFFCILFSLNFIRVQIEFTGKGSAQNNLNNREISSFLIPNISIEEQKELVSVYKKAEAFKQQKEQQALALLAGIDGYLLSELGITLPQQDNRLERRMFTVGARELSGGRFDPSWSLNAHYRIEGGEYPNQTLNHIATVAKGTSITSADVIEGQYPVVAGGQSSPYTHNAFNHAENVITVSASGAYAGYVWHHDYKIFASDCTVIRSKNEAIVSTAFLFELLKLKQKEIYFLQQGAGQPHVYLRDLAVLKLPLPPPAKQAAMLKHIQAIRAQAQQLQQEAAQGLSDAKAQVERLIVGDAP